VRAGLQKSRSKVSILIHLQYQQVSP